MAKKGFYCFFRKKEDFMFAINKICDQRMNIRAQMDLDAALIALHQAFGFGPERNARFKKEFDSVIVDMCDKTCDSAEDDAHFEYAKAKTDEALKAAVGEENFVPYDVRYGIKDGMNDVNIQM